MASAQRSRMRHASRFDIELRGLCGFGGGESASCSSSVGDEDGTGGFFKDDGGLVLGLATVGAGKASPSSRGGGFDLNTAEHQLVIQPNLVHLVLVEHLQKHITAHRKLTAEAGQARDVFLCMRHLSTHHLASSARLKTHATKKALHQVPRRYRGKHSLLLQQVQEPDAVLCQPLYRWAVDMEAMG